MLRRHRASRRANRRAGDMTGTSGIPNGREDAAVDLYWLPLGAGGRSVRLNGRVFEAVAARLDGRRACDLYHSALVVRVPEGRFVIEQAPIPDGDGAERGVVAEGPSGTAGRAPPAVPLRGATLARRRHPRRRRSRREPAAADTGRTPARDASSTWRRSPDPGLGSRRARRRRDVELELAGRMADRPQPASMPLDPPPAGRARTGMACGPRRRAAASRPAFDLPARRGAAPLGRAGNRFRALAYARAGSVDPRPHASPPGRPARACHRGRKRHRARRGPAARGRGRERRGRRAPARAARGDGAGDRRARHALAGRPRRPVDRRRRRTCRRGRERRHSAAWTCSSTAPARSAADGSCTSWTPRRSTVRSPTTCARSS